MNESGESTQEDELRGIVRGELEIDRLVRYGHEQMFTRRRILAH